MLRNYIITAFRNLVRNKTFTILNVGGLVLGVGCAIVIFSYIHFESNFNTYNSNYDRIYRTTLEGYYNGNLFKTQQVPHPLGKALREESANLEEIAQFYVHSEAQLSVGEGVKLKNILEEDILFSDENLFDILDFKWLAGEGSIGSPQSTVLSRQTAEKLFGKVPDFQNILGEFVTIDNTHRLQVMGVYEDVPTQSDFQFSMIIDYDSQEGVNEYFGEGAIWGRLNGLTNVFLLLSEGADSRMVAQQLDEIYQKHNVMEDSRLDIQPLSELHYDDELGVYNGRTFPKQASWTLYVIGLLLIIASSINFVNLATAQATNRAKEVGIRKVLGSGRAQLMGQHLTETFIIVFVSMIGALAVAELLFKWIEPLIGQTLSLTNLSLGWLIPFLVVLILGIVILTGIYPSLIISSFKPVQALKATLGSVGNRGKVSLRRVLVVVQFVISQALLVGTLVAFLQNEFLRSQNLGFYHSGIISIELPEIDQQKTSVLKNEFLRFPEVSHASAHLGSPVARTNNTGTIIHKMQDDKELEIRASFKEVDEDYLDLFEIKLLAGQNVSKSDPEGAVLINRSMLEDLGIATPQDALGTHLTTKWGAEYVVKGVIEDFYSRSLRNEMWNLILSYREDNFYELAIRVKNTSQGTISSTLDKMEETWSNVYPEYVLNYDFLDETIESQYRAEDSMVRLFRLFAVLAIVIGSLGLYGLIDFIAIKKMKEIGIRKVLGASLSSILSLFIRELLLLVIISVLIAGPLMYLVLQEWLSSYAYHLELGPGIFVISFLIITAIAVITMGYRSFRASNLNPVLTLKDE